MVEVGKDGRKHETQGHLVVNADHERPESGIDGHIGAPGGHRAKTRAIDIGHDDRFLNGPQT